ncbi:MAG TPA: LysE family translocator, partial [Halococcus sp.]|nr:LysE family translocator [Halococcus sp.]
LVHTSAAVLGLSAILRTSAVAYTVVKYVGALYLLYLGIQTIRRKEEFNIQRDDTDADNGDSYRRGVKINTLNPKVAIFFLAFLPQFVTANSSAWLSMLLLGVLYSTLTLCYLGTLAFMSSRVQTVLTTHPRVTDVIRWAAGSAIVGFGIEVALSDRTPG